MGTYCESTDSVLILTAATATKTVIKAIAILPLIILFVKYDLQQDCLNKTPKINQQYVKQYPNFRLLLFIFLMIHGTAIINISYSYIFLSGMKPKTTQNSNFTLRSPFKTQRFDPPIYLVSSIDSSVKKSSSSTYLTERSSSRNKILIPNSQKLASFFSSSRPHDSQKSYSTTSTQNRMDRKRPDNEGQEKKAAKIQFLKYNVNRDYFDENAEHNLKGRYDKNAAVVAKNGQENVKSPLRNECNRGSNRPLSRQGSYKSQTLLRCDRIQLPKVKISPKILVGKFFAKPAEKHQAANNKDKRTKIGKPQGNNPQNQRKPQFKNQFQYTFGLNY